ncbi:MAG: 50S ribosomal protein L4 [Bacteroidota bacterium]
MELPILQYTGQDTGRKITLSDQVFGIKPNDHAIYLAVKQHLANRRQGTHKAKERGEIAGSTRKMRRQKGSGKARIGSLKSSLLRGGGRVFGPRPRDYGFKLNKKLKQLASQSVLVYKAQEDNILVLEDFSFAAPKTQQYDSMLRNLNLAGHKTLLILPKLDKQIALAGRNIPDTAVSVVDQIHTYSLLRAKKLLISETALAHINEKFA